MNIDTNTIRRLRDGLVKRGSISSDAELDEDIPVLYQQAVLERFAPFAETMYLMMLIDGHAASVELDAIHGAMQILTDGNLDHYVLNDVFKHCARKVEEYGVDSFSGGTKVVGNSGGMPSSDITSNINQKPLDMGNVQAKAAQQEYLKPSTVPEDRIALLYENLKKFNLI